MYVYLIHNTVNGKYYVGKTTSKDLQKYLRDQLHCAQAGYKCKPYLYNAMRKYPDPANWQIHPLMSTLKTDERLCEQEKFLIALFTARDPNVGYNVAKGGIGGTPKGYHHRKPRTDEHRRKLSETQLRLPKQTKEHISAAVSASNRRRKGKQGHKHSLATRQKMSEKAKQRCTPEWRKAWGQRMKALRQTAKLRTHLAEITL